MDRFRFLDAPALPQAQVMPQVEQPFQMPQGIAGLNTQNQFTLPSGETIDLAQIQANLAGLNIPGMQLPSPVAQQINPDGMMQPTIPPVSAVEGIDPFAPSVNAVNTPVSMQPESMNELAASQDKFAQPREMGTAMGATMAGEMPRDLSSLASNFNLPNNQAPVAAPMPSPVAASLGMPTAMAMAPPTPMSSDLLTGATTQPINLPTPVEQPLAPYTGAGQTESPNYIPEVTRNETGMDATTQQLLFGLDGQGGFIPGAMQAAEKTFFNADGTPRVVEEQRAGFSGDQTSGMDLTRANVGSQNRFLQGAEGAFGQGVSDIGQGIQRGRGYQEQGLGAIQGGIGGLKGELGGVEGIQRGAAGEFGQQVGGIADRGINATERFGNRLGESENLMRGTTGAYDQSMTDQFYNPYEDKVVQQTIDDVLESGDKQDMAARARDIQTGGESAFGSRARLGASERREALGRGLGEALGGIRSRGFSEAQQTGMGEFARQRQAERAASQGLAGLSGARLGSQQNLGSQLTGLAGQQLASQQNLGSSLTGLAGTRFGAEQVGAGALSNMGGLEAQYGQNLGSAQFGLGSNLQGLGSQTQQAGAFDVSQLMGQGGLQQQQAQAVLDAQRANQLTAQAAPLAQYQALSPFINMAPKGSFQTSTRFTPRPSAMMAGINTGLGAFGAFGSMARGTRAT